MSPNLGFRMSLTISSIYRRTGLEINLPDCLRKGARAWGSEGLLSREIFIKNRVLSLIPFPAFLGGFLSREQVMNEKKILGILMKN